MGWFGVIRGHQSYRQYHHSIECIRFSIHYPKSLYFDTPLAFNASDGGGSPGTISVKFSMVVRGWPAYAAVKKYCRKVQPLNRVHQRYRQTDRQTTDRGICDSKDPNVT